MHNEITAAVLFLVRLIERSGRFSQDQLESFRTNLITLLTDRFKNHWFPDQPHKGQGYRCIRVNGHSRRDQVLESAANAAGVKYEDLSLPIELTLWVDPNEVCCRFGEYRGSYCTLASFEDKSNETSVDNKEYDDSDASSEEQETLSEGEKSDTASSTSTNESSNSSLTSGRNNVTIVKKMKGNLKSHYNCGRWVNQHPQIHSPFSYMHQPCLRAGPPMAQQPWFNMMQPIFICPPFMPRGKRYIHSMHASNHQRNYKMTVKV